MLFKDARFCVIDLETTGLNISKDEIIAFAAIPMHGSRITVHESFYTLVKPMVYKLEAMKHHGIGRQDLEGAPLFKDVAEKIRECLEGIMVGHCVEYDHGILKKHFKRIGQKLKKESLDIAQIEQWLGGVCGKPCPDLSLDSMTRSYGLEGYYRHNAMADAFYTAQIFQLQMKRLAELRIDSVYTLKQVMKSRHHPIW